MKRGYLSDYFEGVAAKRLSTVEADPSASHQHEFQGISPLMSFIGKWSEPKKFAAKFLYLDDNATGPITDDGSLTVYDSRRSKPRSSEYRMYFVDNAVTRLMAAGDLLLVAKLRDQSLLVIVAANGSSISAQISWLFDINSTQLESAAKGTRFVAEDLDALEPRLQFASSLILEQIGVELDAAEDDLLELIIERLGDGWPTTKAFSPLARSLVEHVDAREDPDAALVAWVDKEYVLYRTLEKHMIIARLEQGFSGDSGVEEFLAYSLSVQNRRKSRSGSSLENHLEEILVQNGVSYSRGAKTEVNSKPDFTFPGIDYYLDGEFPSENLHMLAVKRSAKDRWRQILAEASRIKLKHLLTLEPSITASQTDEMKRHGVRLVVPESLHPTFAPTQQKELLSLRGFIDLTKMSQA